MNRKHGFSLIEVVVALALLSILLIGVVGMIGGATNSANREALKSAANGEMRTGLQTLQNSIGEADRPLMYVPATQEGAGYLPQGNEIIYSRTEDKGPSMRVAYAAERIRLVDEDGNDPATTNKPAKLILQRITLPADSTERQSRISDLSNPNDTEWQNAPTRVLLTNLQPDKPLFTFKERAGKNATVLDAGSGTRTVDSVGLVDINLTRDDDGSEGRYSAASLTTSVYLRKVAGRSTLSNPVGCEE